MSAQAFFRAGIAAACALVSPTVWAQLSYTDLTPPGYQAENGMYAQGVASGVQAGYGNSQAYSANYRAYVWGGTAASAVDITPSAYGEAEAFGVGGGSIVGYGNLPNSNQPRALLWTNNGANYVDLQPAGYNSSMAFAVSGNQQVGWGINTQTQEQQALLWNGSANSYVALASANDYSRAFGVSGGFQVGDDNYHAMLWNGTAASGVDLNPAGYSRSEAQGISGSYESGFAVSSLGANNAMLWNGSAASAINLNPTGFQSSIAGAISGGYEAGFGIDNQAHYHALLWIGGSANAIDLNSVLPSSYSFVEADSLYSSGGTVEIVGSGYSSVTHAYDALLWTYEPAPEPVTAIAFGLGVTALRSRRRG